MKYSKYNNTEWALRLKGHSSCVYVCVYTGNRTFEAENSFCCIWESRERERDGQKVCVMVVALRCGDGYCTQNILQVMNCFDIALWVPQGWQNRWLEREKCFERDWKEGRNEHQKMGITGVNKEKDRRREWDREREKMGQESVKEALRRGTENGSQDTEWEMRGREVTVLCVWQIHRSAELLFLHAVSAPSVLFDHHKHKNMLWIMLSARSWNLQYIT